MSEHKRLIISNHSLHFFIPSLQVFFWQLMIHLNSESNVFDLETFSPCAFTTA